MSVCTHVLELLVLMMGLAKCFSFDIIIVDGPKRLLFFNNGTQTLKEDIPSANKIKSIIYDPVQFRVLLVDSNGWDQQICSYDLLTGNIQTLVTRPSVIYLSLAYDPVTQLLFWHEGANIYSFSLNSASTNKALNGNLIVTLNGGCEGLAVDSCGGYIYGITDYDIERARFDGSEREVLIDGTFSWRTSLAIDQQTQKMYWTESRPGDAQNQVYIESADFNGKNRRTLYTVKNEYEVNSLTVSKDFIYWNGIKQRAIWQLSKNLPQQLEAKIISQTSIFSASTFHVIAANNAIKDQLKGNQNCETLKSLILNKPECKDIMLCAHGMNVTGESRCECTQGHTGEKCDIYVCQNYCLQGNCSVSAEGQPKCSCKAGYSGQRCEVNAFQCLNSSVCSLNEEDAPVGQCTADFEGETCGLSICKNYCFQGNCSVNAEGQPICSCEAGYAGQRCEVNACHGYCLNNGVCFLNEENSPVCQCTIDYGSERCGVPVCKDYCFQGNCNVSAEGKPICSCTDGYSRERCDFNACHDYCLNNGVCFLNEEEQTVCQCTADYEGERCDIAITHTGVDGDNMTQQILSELRREVKQAVKQVLQSTMRSEVKQVIKEDLQSSLRNEVKKVIKKELQNTLHSEVNKVQVIKEDLQRTLQFYSDKNDENEAKIQKYEMSIKDLENNSVGLENHDETTSKAQPVTFLETN